jgi:hypothetical protein
MVLKEADDRSEDIAELKRLKDASAASFGPAIQKQIDNIYAGVAGERDAAHFINREFGNSERMAVFHDLRIGVDGDYAQMDHLVIHRFQAAAWVLETKNYAGRLSCDEHGDWTTWLGGKPRSIPSPINQARRHCETLRLWLKANGIKVIQKIEPVVLISPTSSVNRKNLPADTHIVKSDNFGEWWRRRSEDIGVGRALGMMGRHLISGMSHEDFLALGRQLADAHVPTTYDWRAMLRLPLPAGPAKASEAEPMGDEEPAIDNGLGGREAPQLISTPHGDIKITRLKDGRYALRNDKDEALIELVRGACKGKAHWNPRYRNWLVSEDAMPGILSAIGSGR